MLPRLGGVCHARAHPNGDLVKYFCEACERLVPPASVRMEDGLLVVKCSRCKVEMRGAPETDERRAPPPAAAAKAQSAESDPLISLALDDAELDPIQNEPTRRMVVPAELLAAIQAEEETRKKGKEPKKESLKESAKESAKEGSRPKEKGPLPVLTPAIETKTEGKAEGKAEGKSTRAPEPVKAPERTRTPAAVRATEPAKTPEPAPSRDRSSRQPQAEQGGASLMVLRLSEVQARTASSDAQPAARAPAEPERPPGPNLRVVRDSEPTQPEAPAAATGPEDPFMPPSGFCPKCVGTRREGTVVCPHCGLDFSRFKADELRPSPLLSSTWQGVVELWDTKSAHDKVLALASEKGELPALGRLYRIRLARHPDDAMAQRGREEVVRLASAGSLLMPTPPPDKRTKVRMGALGLALFVLFVIAVAMGVKVRHMLSPDAPPGAAQDAPPGGAREEPRGP
jgi:hypothetical protein